MLSTFINNWYKSGINNSSNLENVFHFFTQSSGLNNLMPAE